MVHTTPLAETRIRPGGVTRNRGCSYLRRREEALYDEFFLTSGPRFASRHTTRGGVGCVVVIFSLGFWGLCCWGGNVVPPYPAKVLLLQDRNERQFFLTSATLGSLSVRTPRRTPPPGVPRRKAWPDEEKHIKELSFLPWYHLRV